MPKGKRNVNAYGKSWSPIDLPNLEKAIKLYERLNYLQDHFANSLSGSHNIMQQINETQDIQNELQKLGIKLTKEQSQEVANSIKEIIKNSNKIQGSTYGTLTGKLPSKNPYDKKPSPITYSRPDTSVLKQKSFEGYFKNAGDIYNTINQNKLYDKALNAEAKRLKASGSIMSDSSIQKVAEMNLKNGKMGNEASKLLKNSATGFNKGASILQTAVDVFKAGVDIFVSGIKQGFNNQVNAYESSFSNIAARNFTTNEQYFEKQKNLNNELSDLGLEDNVRSSDVQNMWNKLASNGANEETMFAQGIENVITEKIVPYLDTSSVLWQQLQSSLGPTFIKQMRGINKATLDVADNTYYTEKIVKDILPLMQYLSDGAEDEAAKGAAEMSGFTAKALDMNMSQTEVDNLTSTFSKLFTEPGKIITEGTAIEKYAWEQINNAGLSMDNPEDYAEILGILASSQKYFADMLPDAKKSLLHASAADVAGDKVGINLLSTKTWQNKSYDDINKMVEAGNKASNELEDAGNKTYETLKKGDMQSSQDKRDTWLENIINDVAYLKEKFPTWFDLIGVAVKGIVGGLAVSVIGKGIGALAGSTAGGTGKGILAAVGGAGGIALGAIGGAVAGVALANAIHEGVMRAANKENEKDKKKQDMKTKALSEDLGISEAEASILNAGSNITNSDKNWLGVTFDTTENAALFGAQLGTFDTLNEADFKQTLDKAYDETDTLKYNKAKIGKSLNYGGIGLGKETLSNIYNAWLIGLYSQGYTGKNASILEALSHVMGVEVTPDEETMKNIMSGSTALSRNQFKSTVDLMTKADMWLWNENGKWVMPNESDYDKVLKIEGIPSDRVEFLNSHRYGLDKVPYDDYPALLHENETVLTASTANELRNLTDTYRETSQQSISFDTIIQNQTTSLLNKMDQIINTITNSRTEKLEPSWNINSTLNNMKHLRNLSSFNN